MSEVAVALTPIETHYKGYRFRSRLEARWAVVLDALNIAWVYEPQSYRLSDGSGYLPDFWLTDLKVFAEVKPEEGDFSKAYQLAKDAGIDVLLLVETPDAKTYSSTGNATLTVDALAMKAGRSARFEHGEFPLLPGTDRQENDDVPSIDTLTVAEYRKELINQVLLDDSTTCCRCCGHRARNDSKGMTRWQAQALKAIYDFAKVFPDQPIHASTLLQSTCPEGMRDHGVALLRHWGLLVECGRPEGAPPEQKGSRGLTGFYLITALGKDFVEGTVKVPKNIVKPFGQDTPKPDGKLISFQDALKATLVTNEGNNVVDGTTYIEG